MRLDTLRKIRMKIKSGALREFCHEAKWVWRYIRRYRLAVGIYILLGLLSTLMGLGTSVASKYLIDAVTGYKTGAIGTAAAAMAGMLVLSIVLRSVSSLVGAKNSVFIHNEIQAEVYEAVLHTAWEPLEDYRPGDLLSRLTSDVDTVSASVTSFAPGLISGLAQFFGALIIMFYFDPTMALIALIAVPVSAVLSRMLVGRMREHNRQMKAISSDVMSFYEDSLTRISPASRPSTSPVCFPAKCAVSSSAIRRNIWTTTASPCAHRCFCRLWARRYLPAASAGASTGCGAARLPMVR